MEDRNITSKCMIKKQGMKSKNWLQSQSRDELSRTLYQAFGFCEMQRISLLGKQQLASQEGLCSMDFVRKMFSYSEAFCFNLMKLISTSQVPIKTNKFT
jgi:hypothetical protein